MKKKILFFIHDLGQGGAEKVLVNLVNNMDPEKYDITLIALFGGGVNEQFLREHVRYRAIFSRTFRGNSHLMKLFSPERLHRMFIHEHYDAEISFLEGPSARVISGCPDRDTKLVSWIHCTMKTEKQAASSFRSVQEAEKCYRRFDRIVCVADTAREAFARVFPDRGPIDVLYNVNESSKIRCMAEESVAELSPELSHKLISVGKLDKVKGYDRLISILKRLSDDGSPAELYLLGKGEEERSLREKARRLGLEKNVHFLGYQTNPYKYVSKCDLFVCSSYAEGFSTAATEALIVGTPVCTTEVSGMKEMLGENNEYGIVTGNNEEALYKGIKRLLDDPKLLAYYKKQVEERGKMFNKEKTVQAVEEMLEGLFNQ